MKNVEGIFIGGSFASFIDWICSVSCFDCVAVCGDALLWCECGIAILIFLFFRGI